MVALGINSYNNLDLSSLPNVSLGWAICSPAPDWLPVRFPRWAAAATSAWGH